MLDYNLIDVALQRDAGEVLGLSTLHNRPLGKFDCWIGGGLVKVSKPKNTMMSKNKVAPPPRGEIKGFSSGSRRRLMRMISTLKKSEIPIFVTLTYPSDFPIDYKVWKRDLSVFLKRLKRKFPQSCGIWKEEFQKRGAVHFHLMVWGVDYIDLLSFVGLAWYEVVGSGDEKHFRAGTRVENIRSWKGVMSYASKYLGKIENLPSGIGKIGRVWGVFGRENLPFADLIEKSVTVKQAIQLIRFFRRYAHLKSRDYQSLSIYCDNPARWLQAVIQLE